MSRRTVVVVHREPLVAEAIAGALERYPWLVPIAIGRKAEDAVEARTDAAVIDGRLGGAAEAAEALRARGRSAVVLGSRAAGPVAWFETDHSLDDLAHRLAPGIEEEDAGDADRLTVRERQVLGLVAKGFAGKQVAKLLGISPKTVEQHKTRIYGKLGVPNQAAAVSVAGLGTGGVTWISSGT